MDYLRRRTLMVVMAVVLLVSVGYGLLNREADNIADSIERDVYNPNEDETAPVDTTEDDPDESDAVEESGNTIIFVDIDGAVNNPGTFQLPEGTRLCTLIEMAGGLLENADTRYVNRAEKLHDEQKVYIPEEGEETSLPSTAFEDEGMDSNDESDGMVNINTADKSGLESLPGIGEVLATRIIEYRERNERFSCIEDIMKVSGIADGKFNQIKGMIKVD